jgi:hypothetical protein
MFQPYHLSRKTRVTIMLLLIASFFVISPALILYTAGYRYNFNTHKVSTTGVLSIDVEPDDASVYINDEIIEKNLPLYLKVLRFLQGKSTTEKAVLPLRFSDLTPDVYHVYIEKEGYKSWDKEVTVENNKTTYIKNIELFLEAQPTPLFDTNDQVFFSPSAEYFIRIENNTAKLSHIKNPETILFTSLSEEIPQNVIWSPYDDYFILETTTEKKSFISLVSAQAPDGGKRYQLDTPPTHIQWINESIPSVVIDQNGTLERMTLVGRALLDTTSSPIWYVANNELIWSFDKETNILQQKNTGQHTQTISIQKPIEKIIDINQNRIIALTKENIITIATDNTEIKQIPATALFYNNATKEWIAWSPWELWTLYNQGGAELRNRTSEKITFIRPLDKNGILLIVTENKLLAFNPNTLYYTTHELLADANIEKLTVDTKEKLIYFLGTIKGKRGVYSLAY